MSITMMFNHWIRRGIRLGIFTLGLVTAVFAQANHHAEQEIAYLKQFIASSPCQYNRNGDLHTAPEALKHIQKKYDYFKDEIHTAEDFINKSASKSTMSGKAYTVICPAAEGHGQQTLTSQQWLLRALADFRAEHGS